MKYFFSLMLVLLVVEASGKGRKDSLYVFIGEKISVTQFHPTVDSNEVLMDGAFKAKYRVVQNVYNNYPKDTIEFEAYDHYGTPAFSKFQHVLLYVSISRRDGKLYHEKYLFADVYKTKDGGRWASGYKADEYNHSLNANTAIKPRVIEFENEVSYDISKYSKRAIEIWFPAPYYRIENGRAIVVMGNYAEELFELTKSGVLKAREVFE